jgi:hypothetical protein
LELTAWARRRLPVIKEGYYPPVPLKPVGGGYCAIDVEADERKGK